MVKSGRGSGTKPNKLPAKQMLDLAKVKDLGSKTLQSPPLSTKASFFWQTMFLWNGGPATSSRQVEQ
jgi:hypothetical protein